MALVNPSEDDEVKDAWGWIGVLIIVVRVISFALIRGPSVIASLQRREALFLLVIARRNFASIASVACVALP
jgi:hypothetical protein